MVPQFFRADTLLQQGIAASTHPAHWEAVAATFSAIATPFNSDG
jgi:hypothetical protein